MSTIRAIETEYAGYRFRSRLEARWAVFFTLAGYRWEYEPEGFELPGGTRYLPDFRVRCGPPGMERVVWYEVKPSGTTSDAKVDAFVAALSVDDHNSDLDADPFADLESCILLAGDPVEHLEARLACPRCGALDISPASYTIDLPWSRGDVYCYWCDLNTPCGSGNRPQSGFGCEVEPYKGQLLFDSNAYARFLTRLHQAAIAARSTRFDTRRAA